MIFSPMHSLSYIWENCWWPEWHKQVSRMATHFLWHSHSYSLFVTLFINRWAWACWRFTMNRCVIFSTLRPWPRKVALKSDNIQLKVSTVSSPGINAQVRCLTLKGWKQKCSKCYWLKKLIEQFCIQPSKYCSIKRLFLRHSNNTLTTLSTEMRGTAWIDLDTMQVFWSSLLTVFGKSELFVNSFWKICQITPIIIFS